MREREQSDALVGDLQAGYSQTSLDLNMLDLMKERPLGYSGSGKDTSGKSTIGTTDHLFFGSPGQMLAATEKQPEKAAQDRDKPEAPDEKKPAEKSDEIDIAKTGFKDVHFFDHTARFDKLIERYGKDGWTPEVEKAMTDLCLDRIKGADKLGQFGVTREQWQDIRTAMKISMHEGKFDQLIGNINEGLKQPPINGQLKLEVVRTEGYKPFIGAYKPGQTSVQIQGGQGGQWQSQLQMFTDKSPKK